MAKTNDEVFKPVYYGLYDKVSKEYRVVRSSSSDSAAVRDFTVVALADFRIPLRDFEVHKLEVSSLGSVDWNLYKFPESNAEALAPLGASPEEIKEVFSRNMSELSKEDK